MLDIDPKRLLVASRQLAPSRECGRKLGIRIVFGHRGSPTKYPENTMLSLRQAVLEGANGIECDIQKAADGTFIIMHDTSVDRTTNGTGNVADLGWDYLSTLDAGYGTPYAGRDDTRIPLLDDVLDEFEGKPVFLLLHCYIGVADIDAVISKLRNRDMVKQAIIFATAARIKLVKITHPDVFVVNDGTGDPATLLSQAIAENWDAISPGSAKIEPTTASIANCHGKYLLISTVGKNNFRGNDTQGAQVCVDWGINLILADDPSAVVPVVLANGITLAVPGELQ